MSDPISRIELFHVVIPLPEKFYPAWIPNYPQTSNNFTLLRITSKSGLVGHSAGISMERERAGLGSLLGPYLLGVDALDLAVVNQRLREATYLGWRNSWIEAAFWDLKAKAEGKPLYKLLQFGDGNPDTESGENVSKVDVYFSMGETWNNERHRRYLDDVMAKGIRSVKIRVHGNTEAEDILAVRQAREHVGPDFDLRVDANQGWRVALLGDAPLWDLDRAHRFGLACDEYKYSWLEEPLDMYNYDDQAELRRRIKTPVAGGELNAGWHEFKIMLEKGSYDYYQPDVTLAGGIGQAQQLMKACAADDALGFSPHTWTNGIGFLINLQVYGAWPRRAFLEYPFQPPGWIPSARDGILKRPIEVDSQGCVEMPQEPGIGIEIDSAKLRRYGRRFYNLTKPRLALHTIKTKGLRTALELGRLKGAQ